MPFGGERRLTLLCLLFISKILSFLDDSNALIIGLSLLISELMQRMQTVGYVHLGCYSY